MHARSNLSKPIKFVSGCMVKYETDKNSDEDILMTSTECADKKVNQLKGTGIGLQIMKKMGYKEGGLGKYGQGIVEPIEVDMRPKFWGMGYENYSKTPANVTALQKTSDDQNKALSPPSEKRNIKHVIARELRLAELDMQIIECDQLNHERKKVVVLRKEKERLIMEVIFSALDQLNNDSRLGNLSLESLGDLFKYLKIRFPDEYKIYDLSTVACSFAFPLFSRLSKGIDPLIKLADHKDVISLWKDLLQGDNTNSPYGQLFIEAVFCAVNRSSSNTWQATNPLPLLHFLDIWEQLTPQVALKKIIATKHICSSRKMFVSYRKMNEPQSMVMGNGTVSKIEGTGKVILKLSSGDDLVLSNVLHVPNIAKNLISRPILSNKGFKLVVESNKFIITECGVHLGNGYLDEAFSKLSVYS